MPPSERLWITDPRRVTCLAKVTQVKGDQFTVDRALFAPRSTACRHPQYADEGTVWWDGEKRRLASVRERGGHVWYQLRGTVPTIGAELQCQLDQDIRNLSDRAHTAMHLLIAALRAVDAPPMSADPEVKGGGHFRITLAWAAPPTSLKEALDSAQRHIDADLIVDRAYAPKHEASRSVTPQSFQPPEPVPGPDVLSVVTVGDVCAYPCDGTHVDRTSRIGRLQIAHARQGKDGFVVVGRVR